MSADKNYPYGQHTDTGMLRGINQDSVMSRHLPSPDGGESVGLFIVADGLGGHADGEKASKLAIDTIAQVVNDLLGKRAHEDALRIAIEAANDEIIRQLPGSGTAITAALIENYTASIAHVGDTRAYLVTEGGLDQLTVDHTLVQQLVAAGQITPEQADDHPIEHVLYQAVGIEEEIRVDTWVYDLPRGSRLLMCSDGLWKLVKRDKLQEVILRDANPQEACDKLVALANYLGGTDNITAIVVNLD
jgi:protein phosphatase